LAATGTLDKLTAEGHAQRAERPYRGFEVLDLDHDAIPAPGRGRRSVREVTRRRGPRPAQPEAKIVAAQDHERRSPTLHDLESERVVEGQRGVHILYQVPDDGHRRQTG